MPLLFFVVILLVVTLAQVDGQVVFRPHFLYKHRQQEKAEKENKRRQETLEQQQIQPVSSNTDPYYSNYYYQYQTQGGQFNGNYYPLPYPQYLQPRANRVDRSAKWDHPLKMFSRHFIGRL